MAMDRIPLAAWRFTPERDLFYDVDYIDPNKTEIHTVGTDECMRE